jgi:hypothetical protein
VLGRYHIFRTADFQDVDEHNRVRSEIIAKIRSKISSNTLLVDPTESLCPTFGECSESLDGKIAYWNSQHMNRIGSLKLVDLWKVVLNEAVTG